MKITLLALLLTVSVRAFANPDSLKEFQDCSTGQRQNNIVATGMGAGIGYLLTRRCG